MYNFKQGFKNIREYIFFVRQMFRAQEDDFHYLHPTKAGGKILKSFFGMLNDCCPDRCIVRHNHIIKAGNLKKGSRVIISIRDPAQRFISSYYNSKRHYQKTGETSSQLEEFYKKFPDVESAILALLSNDDDIFLNEQTGKYRHLSYWISDVDLSNISELFVLEVENIASHSEKFLELLLRECDHSKGCEKALDVFLSNSYRHTSSEDYDIDAILLENLKSFFSEDYHLIGLLKERSVLH